MQFLSQKDDKLLLTMSTRVFDLMIAIDGKTSVFFNGYLFIIWHMKSESY